jgi:nucleotide sugar dehydrogenase
MTAKVAIIGMGFVGGAIHSSFANNEDIELLAIDPAKGWMATYNDITNFDAVFVCVPSPQRSDGSCDTSILVEVLKQLESVNFKGVIISKVTAIPSVYIGLQTSYPNLVHAPEFLTAANAVSDYINGSFAIIGGSTTAYRNEAERIIRLSQPNLTSVTHCSIGEASFSKYTINSFLATKVIFMNEMAKLAEDTQCNWENIKQAVAQDKRLGVSHMQVPGPDGEFGFGGMCFPKDTNAMLKFAEWCEQDLSVLATAVAKNNKIRLT